MSTPKARACAAASPTKVRPVLFKAEMVRAILDGRKTQTRRIVKMPPHVLRRRPPYEILFYNTGSGQYPGGHENYTGDQPPGLLVRCSNGYPEEATTQRIYSPKGIPGDELYVRETWRAEELSSGLDGIRFRSDNTFVQIENSMEAGYRWVAANDNGKHGENWRPSIFMPRWASRIQLEVTGVRVERVQDITEDDARAEGFNCLTKDGGVTYKYGLGCAREGWPGTGTDGAWIWSKWEEDPRKAFEVLWDEINGKKYPWESNPHVWVYDFKRK